MTDVILDQTENDDRKMLVKKKKSSSSSRGRSLSRKSDRNLNRRTKSCGKVMTVVDSNSSQANNESNINVNSLKRFGLDFNLSEETLISYSSCSIKHLSSSCGDINDNNNNINIDDIMDPRRWSSVEDCKILQGEKEQEQQPIEKTKRKTSKPKKTSGSGGGPRFVPPKSNDFVPPCSYIPELPRWNFLDRLSEEVAPPGFLSTRNGTNSSFRPRTATGA